MVDWLSGHLLVGRSQKENAADLRELLVTFLSKMTLYRRRRRATLWCMRATALRAGSRSFRAGSPMTLYFQCGSLVHPKRLYMWVHPRGRYKASTWRRRCLFCGQWRLPNPLQSIWTQTDTHWKWNDSMFS